MPAVTKEQRPIPSKKRRRDSDYNDVHTPLYGAIFSNQSIVLTDHPALSSPSRNDAYPGGVSYHNNDDPPNQPRRILPLPTAKRIRVTSGEEEEEEAKSHSRSISPSTSRRRTKSPQAAAATYSSTREGLQETTANSRLSPARANPGQLSRCHICHRKPTRKSDLDSFADCQGCGQRACFVCLRQCLGWTPGKDAMPRNSPADNSALSFHMEDADAGAGGTEHGGPGGGGQRYNPGKEQNQTADSWDGGGHHPVVCSRCCVERGPDGDVVCLGCLPFVEG